MPGPSTRGLSPAPIDTVLAQAVAAHQEGRSAAAAALYGSILERDPRHFDATHLLGVIALQDGRLDRAQELIGSALAMRPENVAALNNLGTVSLRKQDFDAAREQFERVLELDPTSVSALTNLGTALRGLGRPREAVAPLRSAHSADPSSVVICNLLGACLLESGDPNGAATLFEAATSLQPDSADGWSNLAAALNGAGRHDLAREYAQRAVAMRPDSAMAVAARAAADFEQGDLESAIATYAAAVELPGASSQVLNAFANALWSAGRWSEAQAHLQRAIALDGNSASSRWKLAVSPCRPYYASVAEIDESRVDFARSLDELDEWFKAVRPREAYGAVAATQPFYIAYHPYNNRELLGRYGRICSEWMASMPLEPVRIGPRSVDRRIRVGIVSAHIRDHSVWNAITKGWIAHLDKSRFESWLFHLGRIHDAQTTWAKSAADRFVDEPTTLPAWVCAIQEADLDVVIYPEIGMDALTTQLAALRLAPVQAASWGHPETSGLPTLDAYLSADNFEPPQAEDNYSERLVRLPNLGVYVEPLSPTFAEPDLSALGLSEHEPLLLCPGTPYKYTPGSDAVWARIAQGLRSAGAPRGWAGLVGRLRGSGHGKLIFFRSGNLNADKLLEKRLRSAFDAEKVDFDAHVRILPYLDRARFFGLMRRSSLMLDTVGFSGFNNALQAVEAGLPVLARESAFMRGRLASGINRRLGLGELVAESDEQFVARAVDLAIDQERLDGLRAQIVARRAILFGDLAPVRALEDWIGGVANAAIALPPKLAVAGRERLGSP